MKIFTENTQFNEYLGMVMVIDTQLLGYWVLGMGMGMTYGYLSIWFWVLVGQIYPNPYPKLVNFVYKALGQGNIPNINML